MPKIVPVGMPASTFDEPSRGSKTATYLPAVFSTRMSCSYRVVASSSTSTGASSSSDASTPMRPVNRNAFLSTSFVMTSSFFCSSPWTLMFPESRYPVSPVSEDRRTRLLIVLPAVWMDENIDSSSARCGFATVASIMNRDSVIPVSEHTSVNTGGATTGGGVSRVAAGCTLRGRGPTGWCGTRAVVAAAQSAATSAEKAIVLV
mmetsp:Transcript_1836/g.7098  ORF Transcript_1836/g.7098 Transcript_1836/m.7098 type:complete len:204 (+) Transcript_1836:1561-2172(+)